MVFKAFAYCSPKEAVEAFERGGNISLIDVREPGEFRSEHVDKFLNLPLSKFSSALNSLNKSESTYVLCQVGARAANAAAKLAEQGFTSVFVMSGGLNAWKNAGLPIIRGERHVWPLERQVRFVAGLLMLVGLGLSYFDKRFLLLSGFVACGLVFSGITGLCGMALLLGRCPWNRQ